MPYFVLASPDKCPIHNRQCVTLRLFFIQKYASLRSLQKYTKIFSGVILVVRCRCTPSIVAKLSVCCSSQLGCRHLFYPLMLHYRASLLPIISNVLRTNTMFTATWLIYMLTARFVWLIHTSSSLAQPTDFIDQVLTLMPKAEALICVQSYTNCQNHILRFLRWCVINQRVANGYDHCKTILLCLKTIYGRMIVGWYWATKLALGAE